MQGINQTYHPGYSLPLHRIVITPTENDILPTLNDPWRLRIFPKDGGASEYFNPIKTMDGESLNIDFTFTPKMTRKFHRSGDHIVVLEFGEGDTLIPRLCLELNLEDKLSSPQ